MLKNNPILLSITIPTFNRSNSLINTLDSIAHQIGSIDPSLIEIVVSDNCSPDRTEECVNAWIGEHPDIPIRYFRNDENIGFDANCDVAIQRANAIFAWLMSDDDFLEVGAIPRVYSLLEENRDVVFAFVNYTIFGKDGPEDSACVLTNIARVPGGELIVRTRSAFALVSSCVFRRNLWLSADASRHFGTNWIHLLMARDLLLSGESLIIGEKLIRMNGISLVESRKLGRSLHFPVEFFISAHLKFIEYSFSLKNVGYPDNIVKAAIRVAWDWNLRQIVYYKATDDKYLINEIVYIYKEMAGRFGKNILFWVIHVPVLFSPNWLIARTYFSFRPLYKKLKRFIRRFGESDQKSENYR